MRNYKNFDVWKEGISLVHKIYQLTLSFPKTEIYGLQNQMKRAAVSIPSNISVGNTIDNKQAIRFYKSRRFLGSFRKHQ